MTTITTTAERFKDGQSSSACLTLPCVKSLNILQLETCHIRIHLWSRNRHESTIQSRYYLSLSLCLSLALTCFPLTLIHFSVLIAGWLPSVRFRQFQCGFPSMIFSVFPRFLSIVSLPLILDRRFDFGKPPKNETSRLARGVLIQTFSSSDENRHLHASSDLFKVGLPSKQTSVVSRITLMNYSRPLTST